MGDAPRCFLVTRTKDGEELVWRISVPSSIPCIPLLSMNLSSVPDIRFFAKCSFYLWAQPSECDFMAKCSFCCLWAQPSAALALKSIAVLDGALNTSSAYPCLDQK